MRWLALGALFALPVALYMALLYAPTEAFMGHAQRVMYVHVPAAVSAYLAFLVVSVAGIAYLRTRNTRWDELAPAAAEVGVLFTTLTLATGSIWARAVWGWWWTWDPRLTTTLVLWFLYVAYLALRGAVEDPERRARFAAVFGIVAFLDVPVVHLSVTWWRSLHPPNISAAGTQLDPRMSAALAVSALAVTLLAVALIWMRFRIERLQRRLARAGSRSLA